MASTSCGVPRDALWRRKCLRIGQTGSGRPPAIKNWFFRKWRSPEFIAEFSTPLRKYCPRSACWQRTMSSLIPGKAFVQRECRNSAISSPSCRCDRFLRGRAKYPISSLMKLGPHQRTWQSLPLLKPSPSFFCLNLTDANRILGPSGAYLYSACSLHGPSELQGRLWMDPESPFHFIHFNH